MSRSSTQSLMLERANPAITKAMSPGRSSRDRHTFCRYPSTSRPRISPRYSNKHASISSKFLHARKLPLSQPTTPHDLYPSQITQRSGDLQFPPAPKTNSEPAGLLNLAPPRSPLVHTHACHWRGLNVSAKRSHACSSIWGCGSCVCRDG